MKFLSSPENQATWHTGTGYFPTSKGALNEPVDVAWRKQFPQFDVAVKQLQNTPVTKATQGCLLGVMPQARKASEDGLEKALNGTDPKQAMTEAAGLRSRARSTSTTARRSRPHRCGGRRAHRATALAAATFSESTPPAIGIRTTRSAAAIVRARQAVPLGAEDEGQPLRRLRGEVVEADGVVGQRQGGDA